MLSLKDFLAGGVVVTTLVGVAGCGEEKKSTVATNLSQPLPPPPTGSGPGKAGKAGGSQQGANKSANPTGVAD
jgi:hypothetical protein